MSCKDECTNYAPKKPATPKAAPDWVTAARKSYEERWLPMCKAKTCEEMYKLLYNTLCDMCGESTRACLGPCGGYTCPLSDVKDTDTRTCAVQYHDFMNAFSVYDFPAAHAAAVALASRLAEIAGITTGEHLDKPEPPEHPYKHIAYRVEKSVNGAWDCKVYITEQTHRRREFGNKILNKDLFRAESKFWLASRYEPRAYIPGHTLFPDEGQSTDGCCLRGSCYKSDDRPIDAPSPKWLARFEAAVAEYNAYFSGDPKQPDKPEPPCAECAHQVADGTCLIRLHQGICTDKDKWSPKPKVKSGPPECIKCRNFAPIK